MSDEINEDKIRQQTEKLIDLLREHHPEQECEPEGLRIREDTVKHKAAAKPAPVAPVALPMPRTRAEAVLYDVARRHNLTPADIRSPGRSAPIVMARAECYVKLREIGWGYAQMGRYFKRDHSTVLAMLRKYGSTQQAAQ